MRWRESGAWRPCRAPCRGPRIKPVATSPRWRSRRAHRVLEDTCTCSAWRGAALSAGPHPGINLGSLGFRGRDGRELSPCWRTPSPAGCCRERLTLEALPSRNHRSTGVERLVTQGHTSGRIIARYAGEASRCAVHGRRTIFGDADRSTAYRSACGPMCFRRSTHPLRPLSRHTDHRPMVLSAARPSCQRPLRGRARRGNSRRPARVSLGNATAGDPQGSRSSLWFRERADSFGVCGEAARGER